MAGENLAGQPHIAAIHDISCVGRCSLTVALPVLSAAGIETSILPTAILSTHTGGFQNYTYRDLTADILPIARALLPPEVEEGSRLRYENFCYTII